MNTRLKKTRGQVIVMFAICVGLLLGFSALAFDLAYAMVIRAELITALDAAALAALRYVPEGQSAMQEAANRAFDANLPAGKLAVVNPVLVAPTVTNGAGRVDVDISATADAPTYFARWFGHDAITIHASTQTSRRDRNVVLVLDYSLSVDPVLGDIRDGAQAFVDSFSEEADQVGLAAFSTSGLIIEPIQAPFKSTLNTKIAGITGEGWTNYSMGLYWGYRALLELDDPLKGDKLNEIVFFTDGNVNWFPGEFQVRTYGTGRCYSSPARGVFGKKGSRRYDHYVFSYTAPMPNALPSKVPECAGQRRGYHVLQYIEPTWVPDPSPTYGDILPAGVSMSGFANSNPYLGDSTPSQYYTYDPSNTLREQISRNVADNLARSIRLEPGFDIRVHTIGYDGGDGLNTAVLERIANCEGCANVDPADESDPDQYNGFYVIATDPSELMNAFLDVAGYIARITY